MTRLIEVGDYTVELVGAFGMTSHRSSISLSCTVFDKYGIGQMWRSIDVLATAVTKDRIDDTLNRIAQTLVSELREDGF